MVDPDTVILRLETVIPDAKAKLCRDDATKLALEAIDAVIVVVVPPTKKLDWLVDDTVAAIAVSRNALTGEAK